MRRGLIAALGAIAIAATMLFFSPIGSADPSSPGGALAWMPATVTDNNSKTQYFFALRANEDPTTSGVGSVVMELGGPAISLCTVHVTGPLFVNFATAPETGAFPFQNVQCGRAFGQSVAIDGCVATINAHGFLHSDDPNSNVLDGMTLALRIHRTGPNTANFSATISTVTKKVQINGRATGAPIIMPTCP